MQKFIRIRELASTSKRPGRWPVSAATIWRWAASGALPAPVRLGPGTTAWPIEAIEQFEAEQAQASGSTVRQQAAGAASVAARGAK